MQSIQIYILLHFYVTGIRNFPNTPEGARLFVRCFERVNRPLFNGAVHPHGKKKKPLFVINQFPRCWLPWPSSSSFPSPTQSFFFSLWRGFWFVNLFFFSNFCFCCASARPPLPPRPSPRTPITRCIRAVQHQWSPPRNGDVQWGASGCSCRLWRRNCREWGGAVLAHVQCDGVCGCSGHRNAPIAGSIWFFISPPSFAASQHRERERREAAGCECGRGGGGKRRPELVTSCQKKKIPYSVLWLLLTQERGKKTKRRSLLCARAGLP